MVIDHWVHLNRKNDGKGFRKMVLKEVGSTVRGSWKYRGKGLRENGLKRKGVFDHGFNDIKEMYSKVLENWSYKCGSPLCVVQLHADMWRRVLKHSS